jgi:thiamine-phosphate pyrophosphorylase
MNKGSLNKKQKLDVLRNAGLYLVSSEELSNYPSLHIIEEFLKAGGKLFQLREKKLSKKELYELALSARKLADIYGAVFIVNDHVEIALASGADGIHLGQDDLPLKEARRLLGPESIIGVSTHNIIEAKDAKIGGADYINIGPVFATQTKLHAQTISPEEISSILSLLGEMPFTLMGGIKESNLIELLKYKASALAMITEITKAENINSKVKGILSKIKHLPISY